MKEDDARTKWCPHARNQVGGIGEAVNMKVDDRFSIRIKCIASNCMMWKENEIEGAPIDDGHCGLIKEG